MIMSFKDKEAAKLFNLQSARRLPQAIQRPARRKLEMLNAAVSLESLNVTPANRLEALQGDRQGQHSIRINDQYRICFCWKDGHAHQVEIVDYH
jgi:toxin HigB-1